MLYIENIRKESFIYENTASYYISRKFICVYSHKMYQLNKLMIED